MNLYIFRHNGEKINEEIEMIKIEDNTIFHSKIGNIYNLIDYINYNIQDNSKVKFLNFTGNKLNLIISAITRYKDITSVNEYYSIIIRTKKRTNRGR